MYDVHKENDPTNKIRTLHRYMLLPFMGLPSEIQKENPDTRTQNDDIPVPEEAESSTTDDSTSSDSDESDSSLSEETGRILPQRRPPQHQLSVGDLHQDALNNLVKEEQGSERNQIVYR